MTNHEDIIAELNTIVAEQQSRLNAQESQISELYGAVLRLKIENDALTAVNAKNAEYFALNPPSHPGSREARRGD